MVDEQLEITNMYTHELHNLSFYDKLLQQMDNDAMHSITSAEMPTDDESKSIDVITHNTTHNNIDFRKDNDTDQNNQLDSQDMKSQHETKCIKCVPNDNLLNVDINSLKLEQNDIIFNGNPMKTIIHKNSCTVCTHKNIVIDNSLNDCQIELEDGKIMEIKEFAQYRPSIHGTTIRTSCGSFYVDHATPYVKLMYVDDIIGWKKIGTNNDNFFPNMLRHTLSPNAMNASFGSSIAMSSDGLYCSIGGYTHNNGVGCAWLYAKKRNTFELVTELIGNDNIGCSLQGSSVSINDDGNIIIVGGSGDDTQNGACWVFNKISDELWDQHKVTNTCSGKYFGMRTCISGDGKIFFVASKTQNYYIIDVYSECVDDIQHWEHCGKIRCDNGWNTDIELQTTIDGSLLMVSLGGKLFVYKKYLDSASHNYSWIHTETICGTNHKIDAFSLCRLGRKLLTCEHNCGLRVHKLGKYGFSTKHVLENIFPENSPSSDELSPMNLMPHVAVGLSSILHCDMCHNGKTIVIHGTNENGHNVLCCIVKKNKKYVVHDCVDIDDFVSSGLVISSDGKIIACCSETFNEHTGGCFVFM